MAPTHDLGRQFWMFVDRLADHERGHLDAVLVEQLEHPRDALAHAVLVERVLRQVGVARLDRVGNRSGGTGDRLAAGLELHRDGDGEAGAVWPELGLSHLYLPFLCLLCTSCGASPGRG
jgi:hypothetical protein